MTFYSVAGNFFPATEFLYEGVEINEKTDAIKTSTIFA